MDTSSLFPGMRVEIFTSSDELLFEAKVTRVLRDDFAEIERVSDLTAPVTEEAAEVHVRGYNTRQNRGIWLEGALHRFARNREDLWLLEKLKVTGQDSGRTYSRQYNTKAVGTVRPTGAADDAAIPCQVSNLSLGGAAIRTAKKYDKGDELLLQVKVRRGKEQPPLLCAVRRVTELEDGYEYGCEFLDSDGENESRIIKTVLEVQLMGMPRTVDLGPPLW